MKVLFIAILLTCFAITTSAQEKPGDKPNTAQEILVVEASCGQCKFGLPGDDCNLAVRINGKAYFVDGTAIDSHGDAHAKDGFCNAIRKAEVQGKIVDDRFKATYFHLMPSTPAKKVKGKS